MICAGFPLQDAETVSSLTGANVFESITGFLYALYGEKIFKFDIDILKNIFESTQIDFAKMIIFIIVN